MTILVFNVLGVPAPAGSKRGFVVNGRAVLVNDNKPTQKAWRQAVSSSAYEARTTAGFETLTGPVSLQVEFFLPRPKSAKKTAKWKATKPDIDKLLRSTLDGLTDAGIFRDDALVVELSTTKVMVGGDDEFDGPGAYIIVSDAKP
jgi:Holliday junction resolvase RusA-like endonuclease